ncbi:MAG: (2Fe-2S)-binding protein [Deltaproteobacteria bacterium]|nr:(2Fe-2S)-binding protein [Deltaproteobacteria bacterium]
MIIEWSLNGSPLRSEVNPFRRLLDYLRGDLKLLGTKEGCREGKCGACTMWVNAEPVNACLILMGQLHGKEVTTIEGLNEKDRFTPLQESFLTSSAIECGFCIPGMIMSGTALLDENPNPNRLEIRTTLKGHLCACTGYQKILDAIEGVALPPASEGSARMRVRK